MKFWLLVVCPMVGMLPSSAVGDPLELDVIGRQPSSVIRPSSGVRVPGVRVPGPDLLVSAPIVDVVNDPPRDYSSSDGRDSAIAESDPVQELETSQRQVTFFSAKSAEVVEDGEGVVILAEELVPDVQYGVIIETTVPVSFVLVFPKGGSLFTLTPFSDGQFLIRGPPGYQADVLVWPNPETMPITESVVVAPDVKPDPDEPEEPPPADPGDFASLVEVTRTAVSQLDKPTAQRLSQAYRATIESFKRECQKGNCPTLQAAIQGIQSAGRRAGKDPNQDWYNQFFVPIDKALLEYQFKDSVRYLGAWEAIANALASEG